MISWHCMFSAIKIVVPENNHLNPLKFSHYVQRENYGGAPSETVLIVGDEILNEDICISICANALF